MPEAKRSKRSNKRLRMPLSKEADAARRAEVREASERFKRIAEASALALALEEEIAQS